MHGARRRFFRRAYERPRLVRLDNDLALWAQLSDTQGALLYVYGTAEPIGRALFVELLEPGAVVVDVGANVGEFTLTAAAAVGLQGTVLAFEPQPEVFRLISESVRHNGLKNVRLVQAAVSDRSGEATLFWPESGNSGIASLANTATGISVGVSSVTLDDVVESKQVGRVDVLKVDVEGHEPQVLDGGIKMLKTHKPCV